MSNEIRINKFDYSTMELLYFIEARIDGKWCFLFEYDHGGYYKPIFRKTRKEAQKVIQQIKEDKFVLHGQLLKPSPNSVLDSSQAQNELETSNIQEMN